MRKLMVIVVASLLLLSGIVLFAGNSNSAPGVSGGGPYTGYMTNGPDGKSRNVIIINTETGDFEVYDIDNKGYDRKDDVEYYDCISYNRLTKTRVIYRYLAPQK
jgi:hypothetical protein